jgi:hypothetical protein
LHPRAIAVYLPGQMPGNDRQLPQLLLKLKELLEFHPWMLALAVFLACAIGIAAMEQLRDRPTMLAQATTSQPAR